VLFIFSLFFMTKHCFGCCFFSKKDVFYKNEEKFFFKNKNAGLAIFFAEII